MAIKTVAIYTFFDDILKSMQHKEPVNRKTTDAELITVILPAAVYFGGNIETALSFVRSTGLMPQMPGKSRFNRRMHRTGELLAELFFHTGETIKALNINHTCAIDSFPVAVCQNIRIPRNRMLRDEQYRGHCVSKRCCFYGFKVHAAVTADGIPAEYTFTAGSIHDLDGIRQMPLNLPAGSEIPADAAHTGYEMEKMLTGNGIRLPAARKANSKHPHHPCTQYLISIQRKRIETACSDIAKLMPESIHAVTAEGFLIKIIAFIWAYTFDSL